LGNRQVFKEGTCAVWGWAMDDRLRDLADRWRRDYERYDVDRLIWTFNTCLDDPSRIAALEVLMDRLCGDISEVT